MADIFYNAIKQNAAMIKGDVLQFGFLIKGLGDTTPERLTFTCKKHVEDETPLFAAEYPEQITLRSYDQQNDVYFFVCRIPPEFTANVQPGRYIYDLQIEANTDVITLLTGHLEIEPDVTI